ncbi:MAG: hypothetical protein NTV72_00695 [Candidatus Taylorbacteria bacterium]|nr:hypothetical protein [Candidatus Taylorbacteria bacterium]
MTPEERSLLEETYSLAKENNNILKSMRSMNRISTVMRILYWVVILGASFGAYYLIQPYIQSLSGAYTNVLNTVDTTSAAAKDLQNMKGLLDTLKK